MYTTVRQLQVGPGRMEDALAFVGYVVDRLNAEHGASFRASVNIGGDPSAIAMFSQWNTLGEYGAMRTSAMGDGDLQTQVQAGASMFRRATDSIWRVLKPSAEPREIAVVNTASMYMPRVGEALAFALEVADFIDMNTEHPGGVATAVTGARSRLSWFGYGDSLDDVAEAADAIEGSEEYLALYKRAEQLFVPGSLRQSIWQLVA